MIENKGTTLSIHYRYVCNIKHAHKMILQAIDKLDPQPRRIGGKFIENLIPVNAPDKGIALRILMQKSQCQKAFFVGDDETDEDVFRLNDSNLFTICVGRNISSNALFYLREQNEIKRLIAEINSVLREKGKYSGEEPTDIFDKIIHDVLLTIRASFYEIIGDYRLFSQKSGAWILSNRILAVLLLGITDYIN